MRRRAGWGERFPRTLANVLWFLILIVVGLTPMLFDRAGRDVLVLPKTLFFQSGMIVIGALAAIGALLHDKAGHTIIGHRSATILAALGVIWVSVVSMTAVVRDVAHTAPLTMLCYAILFVVTIGVARERPLLPALAALLIPALANAAAVLLQAHDLWQPFGRIASPVARVNNVGLIGNPNTVATYLLLPLLAAVAAAQSFRAWRVPLWATAAVLLWGLFAAQTITVFASLLVALLALAISSTPRIRWAAVALTIVGIVAILVYPATRQRILSLNAMIRSGEIAEATSGRLPAAATALQMFAERPLVGVGPGGFAARYMSHRLRIEERMPQWIRLSRENFGEVHNDHAQILAETGLPGYALFAFALFSVGRMTFRTRGEGDERARFVRLFAFPAAAGFAALALGQFPLELTAVASSAVFAAALCFAWGGDANP